MPLSLLIQSLLALEVAAARHLQHQQVLVVLVAILHLTVYLRLAVVAARLK